MDQETKQRVIQEYVPGKQVTLAHIIANPNEDIYKKLGLVIEKAEGQKCARCWKFSDDVGKLKDPQLCGDCLPGEEALGKI